MPRGPSTKSKGKTENHPPKGTPAPQTKPSPAPQPTQPSKKGIQESSPSQLNQDQQAPKNTKKVAKKSQEVQKQADEVQQSKEAKLEELRQQQEAKKQAEKPKEPEAPVPNPTEHKPEITYLDVNILRKKKSLTRMEKERKEKRDQKKLEKRKLPKVEQFVSAEKIVKASRQRAAQAVRVKRTQAKYKYILEKPAEENRLVVVVRIRGKHGMTNTIKKILVELRLNTVRSAVFCKLTKRNLYLLKLIEPFITYGTPTLRVVRDLITKRGYINPGQNQRTPMNDNATIEKHLGEHNIVCVEDIVNEIWNCGPVFDQVNKFLEPFKVVIPPEKYPNKRDTFAEGGDAGDRGENINDLLQKIL